jgi:Rieske Fe-S protein
MKMLNKASDTMSNDSTTRRGFLNFVTSLLLCVLGFLVAVPAIGYLCAPLRRRLEGVRSGPAFVDAGPLTVFPVGQWHLHVLELVHEDGWKRTRSRQAIWVRRQGESDADITVLSSLCPHLGCPVNWQPDQAQFFCPCHGGVFDATGRPVAGPPPRALDPLDYELRASHLWVRWQDFKIGVSERTAVSV